MGIRYQIQDPKRVAALFGGDTLKIADAIQRNIIDPVSGTLAGMYIKDVQNGKMAQQGNALPTIAQQALAPLAPPMGGMGPPPGAPPMGGMGAPPMGAPPMGGMPPAPPMGDMGAPPMGAPPMGMADGGLAALPVPESMFDEPMDGEYAGGGIVAFASGGTDFYGMSTDLGANLGMLQDRFKPETEFTEREAQYIRDTLSPEAQKKRRDNDLALAGLGLASALMTTPGGIPAGIGKGLENITPILRESAKERRAEEREAISVGAQRELGRNKEQRELLNTGLGMVEKAGGFAEAAKTRDFQMVIARMDDTTKRYLGQLSADTTLQAGRERNKSIADYQTKEENKQKAAQKAALVQLSGKAGQMALTELQKDTKYLRAVREGRNEDARKLLNAASARYFNDMLANAGIDGAGGIDGNPFKGFSAEEIGGE
jgi:hypothetical protein